MNLLNRRIAFAVPLWVFAALPFIAYPLWEYYWYKQVGYGFIKWHTHIALYVYVWLALAGLYALASKTRLHKTAANVFLSLTAIMFALLLAEVYFIYTRSLKTYAETVFGKFVSMYNNGNNGWYHKYNDRNSCHYLTKPEYSYWRPNNESGFADTGWAIAKKVNEKRILTLGDSFTEGDGAPFDSSYPFLLNHKLQLLDTNYRVMNAGICGSDPYYTYVLLRDSLLPYHPDIVIQTLGGDDMLYDIRIRGGMERFKPNYTVQWKTPPLLEPLYALSYTFRLFCNFLGYNDLLMSEPISPAEQNEMNNALIKLLHQYAALCKANGAKLYIVAHPCDDEITRGTYAYNLTPVFTALQHNTDVVFLNLIPAYRHYIAAHHTQAAHYFWKQDDHHNAAGYNMMAQCIADSLFAR